jgi:hypothetical protein
MLTEQDKYKLISILLVLILILSLVSTGTSQTIINNDGRVMVELSDEEKAIKTSSGCIKSKEDLRWETHINNIKIIWEVKYIKDSKIYLLYKNHIKYYESSTITGIRSKYASDLLGREIKIQ